MPLAHHVMFALVDRRVIFPTTPVRVDAYHRIIRIGERFLLGWFYLGVDHIHAVVFCSEEDLPRFCQSVESSWKQAERLEVGFSRYHPKRVADQGHLRTLLPYCLKQGSKLEQDPDPFHLGSNGPDLCGGRVTGSAARAVVRTYLPRVRRDVIERLMIGGPRLRLEEFGPAPVWLTGQRLEAHALAAAAAAIAQPDLRALSTLRNEARAALAQIASKAFPGTVSLERMLGVGRRSVRRLLATEVSQELGSAVRWQLEFRFSKLLVQSKTE